MACYANVIKGLKCQADPYIQIIDDCNCDDCPYDLSNCGLEVPSDAIELLKEQSAQIERLEHDLREARGNKNVQ